MAVQTWVEPRSHWKATGELAGSKMVNATVEDNHGITRDRNRTFDSERDFADYAKRAAGL